MSKENVNRFRIVCDDCDRFDYTFGDKADASKEATAHAADENHEVLLYELAGEYSPQVQFKPAAGGADD